jgi:hypothetical protein
MKTRLAPVLLAALVVLAGTAARAHADAAPGSSVLVLAQPVDFTDPAGVPPGMTVVFVPPAPDGFADGGDGPDGFADGGDGFADGGDAPGGLVWVAPDGFADGGDAPVPDGFVAALARPAGDDFWQNGTVPDGLVAVLAAIPPDGFADGGDLPAGYVPVFFSTTNGDDASNGG